jgi:hypothetical protein
MKSRPFLPAILISICIQFITCTKQGEKNITEARRNILVRDTLVYERQILWWNSPDQIIAYKKESVANSNDLRKAWFKYEKDGSFKAALSNGHIYSGNWELLENATKIKLTSAELSYNEVFEIISLTNEKFEWTDPEHHSFYRMIYNYRSGTFERSKN